MSNSLSVTQTMTDSGVEIQASLVAGSDLPSHVFLYLNTGDTTLGDFQGVSSLSQLSRCQIWTGTPIALFGNKYVRSDVAKIVVDNSTTTADAVVQTLISSLKTLAAAYTANKQSTQVYQIT